MTLAAPADVSRPPTLVLRWDADGTRGQKTAEEDGGRSAPVPEPGAVLPPSDRVQLGADLLVLAQDRPLDCRRLQRIGRGPVRGAKGGREGLPEERPRQGLTGYSERPLISRGIIPPDRGRTSSQTSGCVDLLVEAARNGPRRPRRVSIVAW